MYSLDFSTLPGWIALISSFLVIGQLLISIFFGGLDIDTDADGFGDFDMSTFASPKGIVHFLCGASWYLVLIQPVREGGEWMYYDWIVAVIIGALTTALLALLYYGLSKLACEKEKEKGDDLVGRTGYVYLNNGNGNYDVNISVSGMSSIIQVTSESKDVSLKEGDNVVIKSYSDGIYFIN